MSYIPDPSVPLKFYPPSCDRCQHCDCNSMHDVAASDCPLQGCDMCPDLAELDAHINFVHNQLISLIQKRWVLKNKINTRHDRLTSRLPAEIVSHIFNFVVISSAETVERGPLMCAPVVLGAVCKTWRKITLRTPQLWTSLKVNLSSGSTSLYLKKTKEWLQRSGAVPLSLTLQSGAQWGPLPRSSPPIINLLRSHSWRWKHVKFNGPWTFCHDLLNGLVHIPPIATFEATFFDMIGIERESICLSQPICPKEFIWRAYSTLYRMPLQWNNLTLLDGTSMCMDEILHIIAHANGLRDCNLKVMTPSSGKYPLPACPIIHHNLTHFSLEDTANSRVDEDKILHHLVLPSLKSLHYSHDHDFATYNSVVSFLERSTTPLDFFLFEDTMAVVLPSWYRLLPAITHLNLIVNQGCRTTEDLLVELAKPSVPPMLPNLRQLRLMIGPTEKSFFPLLCDILRDTQWESSSSEDARTDHVNNQINESNCRRPLNQIYIEYIGPEDRPIMDEIALSKVRSVQQSGITVEMVDRDGDDVFSNISRVLDLKRLPFSRASVNDRDPTWWEQNFDDEQ